MLFDYYLDKKKNKNNKNRNNISPIYFFILKI